MRALLLILFCLACPAVVLAEDCDDVNARAVGDREVTEKLIQLVQPRQVAWKSALASTPNLAQQGVYDELIGRLSPRLRAYLDASQTAFVAMQACLLSGGYYSATQLADMDRSIDSARLLARELVDFLIAYEALPR